MQSPLGSFGSEGGAKMLARSIMMGLALVIATAGLAQARPVGDGDFDGDRDVDLDDYAELPRCLAGPTACCRRIKGRLTEGYAYEG